MASGCCCVAVRDRLGGGSVTSRARGGARGAAGAGAGAGAGAAARFLPLGAGARTDAGAGAGAGALLLCTTGLSPASSSAGSSISPARELSKSATISGCKCATGLREVGWRATTCIRAAQGVPKSWFEGMLRTPKCPPPRYIPPITRYSRLPFTMRTDTMSSTSKVPMSEVLLPSSPSSLLSLHNSSSTSRGAARACK